MLEEELLLEYIEWADLYWSRGDRRTADELILDFQEWRGERDGDEG